MFLGNITFIVWFELALHPITLITFGFICIVLRLLTDGNKPMITMIFSELI